MSSHFKLGAVHLGLVVLAVFGLIAATSVAILAEKSESRPFSNRTISCLRDRNSPRCKQDRGPCYPTGDVNNDRKVDRQDADLILQYDTGLATIKKNFLKRGDLNKDNTVNVVDAMFLLQYLEGARTTFDACNSGVAAPTPVIIDDRFPTPTPSPSPSPITIRKTAGPCYPQGDVNNDRKVSFDDADKIQKYDVGLETINSDLLKRGDVDSDSLVNVTDALLIRRYLEGLEITFPSCNLVR